MALNTLYTPSRNSWGSSPTLGPRNIEGFILTKSLNQEVIVLSTTFTVCSIPLFKCVVMDQAKESKAFLISPLVMPGGTTGTSLTSPPLGT